MTGTFDTTPAWLKRIPDAYQPPMLTKEQFIKRRGKREASRFDEYVEGEDTAINTDELLKMREKITKGIRC